MTLCIILIYGRLSMHSTHGHNGATSRSIKFCVYQRFFCTDWIGIRSVYNGNILSIEKSCATVAWSWYLVILHGAIRLWRHGTNGPQIFFWPFTGCCLWSIWESRSGGKPPFRPGSGGVCYFRGSSHLLLCSSLGWFLCTDGGSYSTPWVVVSCADVLHVIAPNPACWWGRLHILGWYLCNSYEWTWLPSLYLL